MHSHELYVAASNLVERSARENFSAAIGSLGMLVSGLAAAERRGRQPVPQLVTVLASQQQHAHDPFVISLLKTQNPYSELALMARATTWAAYDIPAMNRSQQPLPLRSIQRLTTMLDGATPTRTAPEDAGYILYQMIGHALRET